MSIGDNTLHITGGTAVSAVLIPGATTLTGGTAATFDVQAANILNLSGAIGPAALRAW